MKRKTRLSAALLALSCAAALLWPAAAAAEEPLAADLVPPEEEIVEELAESGEEELVIEEAALSADGGLRETEPDESYFTLFLDHNDESGTVTEERVYSGETTVEPEAPVREGWLFEGWYNDPVVGRQFVFGEPLYSDRTLYAHWSVDDWKLGHWNTAFVRGGSNIAYDAESRTLAFGSGELILNRQTGTALEDGYYLAFRVEAPAGVTDDGEIYQIFWNGSWLDFNGANGVRDGIDTQTGRMYWNVYEPISMTEIQALADRNAKTFPNPTNPGNREDLVLEELQGGRGGRAEGEADTESEFVPELKTWQYPVRKADTEQEVATLTVTLDPRYMQFNEGTNLNFFINAYRYRFRVKFALVDGAGTGSYKDQIVKFGEHAAEPVRPRKNGCHFEGWYQWNSSGEYWMSDWAYDFNDQWGVRSSLTLGAKWSDAVQVIPALNLHDTIGVRFYVKPAEGLTADDFTVNTAYTSKYQTTNKTVNLADLTPNAAGEYYINAVDCASDEMSDAVTLTVQYGSEAVFTQAYSIASIADSWLTDGNHERYEPLLRAMLQYGDKAQVQFNNHADTPITPEGAPELVPIPVDYAPGADPTALADYLEYCQFAINLESAVGMSIYIKPKAGYGLNDFTIAVADQTGKAVATTAPAMVKGEIKVMVPGLYPEQLLNDYTATVTVKGVSAPYVRSVMSCAYGLQQRGLAVDLVQALYQYSLAAREIWG